MTKKCSRCKQEKVRKEFSANKSTNSGLASWCKACVRDYMRDRYGRDPAYRERIRERAKKRYKENPATEEQRVRRSVTGRKWRLKTEYGLTPEQHKVMYIDQNGCCAICGNPTPHDKIHTDHDHDTGRVRGLLCCRCNNRLGQLEADVDLLVKMFEYLGW